MVINVYSNFFTYQCGFVIKAVVVIDTSKLVIGLACVDIRNLWSSAINPFLVPAGLSSLLVHEDHRVATPTANTKEVFSFCPF